MTLDPTIEKEVIQETQVCAYDGQEYPQCDMYYDMYHNGIGAWIAKQNMEAFAKKELPLYEQEEYINIIIKENNGNNGK